MDSTNVSKKILSNRPTDIIERNNDINEKKKVIEKNSKRPWKIIMQNIQGLVTEKSKKKIEYMKEYTKEEKILLMNYTETWLNDTIKEDADIEGYKIFRRDRKKEIKKGGVAIYVNDKIEANLIDELSHNKCEMIAIHIPELQTVNIVVYRPPDTTSTDFEPILNKIQDIYKKLEKPDPTIILSGDFNFHFVKWIRMSDNSCVWGYKKDRPGSSIEREQFEKLMSVCEDQCLLQMIEEPTREKKHSGSGLLK